MNLAVNDFWMCDYGRFRAEELNGNDFTRPVLRAGGKARETHWGEALDAVKAAVDAAVAKDPASVLVLGSARLSTEESWLLAQLFKGTVGATQVEFHADLGPERKIKNPAVPGGWLVGKEAAPNSRGAEAAGVARAGKGSALARLLDAIEQGLRAENCEYATKRDSMPRRNSASASCGWNQPTGASRRRYWAATPGPPAASRAVSRGKSNCFARA